MVTSMEGWLPVLPVPNVRQIYQTNVGLDLHNTNVLVSLLWESVPFPLCPKKWQDMYNNYNFVFIIMIKRAHDYNFI